MTKHAAWLAALLLTCATAVAWCVLAAGDPAAPTTELAPADAAAAHAPPSVASTTNAPAERDRSAAARASDSPAAPADRTVVAPPAEAVGPMLQVVEAGSGRPVPGAEVFATEQPRGGAPRWRPGEGGHWAELLVAGVRPTRTDERGCTHLPPIERRVLVAARAPGLFGVAAFARGTADGAKLALERDETVRVRVVDGRGQPRAGIEVALCTDLGQRLLRKASATTDGEGIALLQHVQLQRDKVAARNAAAEEQARALREQMAELQQVVAATRARAQAQGALDELRRREMQARRTEAEVRARLQDIIRASQAQVSSAERAALADADFVVAAEVPELAPAVVRFPALAIPRQVVDLRLGVTGSLVVRLLGPGAQTLGTRCEVFVRTADTMPPPPTVSPELAGSLRDVTMMRMTKALGSDAVRFPAVGAGLTLDVRVRFADNDFDFGDAAVAGPLGSEERLVELRVPATFTVLAGRFVDEQGVPLGGQSAELFVAGATGRIEGERIDSEANGRFELLLRLRRAAPPYTLDVHATLHGQEPDAQPVGALVKLTTLEPGQRHELGDIRLAGLPTLAHGTVRDDRGEPLAGAMVALQTLRVDERGNPRWQDEINVQARSHADGSYRLFGTAPALRLRLVPRARGHVATSEPEIAFGQAQDLVLERLGEISGDGRAPDWMPRGALRVQLLADGKPVRDDELRAAADGAFRFHIANLRAGRYDLRLVLRGAPLPLVQISGLVVAPGAGSDDARLHGLDLCHALYRFVVRAVDQKGGPVHSSSPLLVDRIGADGQLHLVGYPWRGSEVEFFATDPSVEVVVLASGHRPVRKIVEAGESTLTLAVLHPIQLQLPGLRQLVGAATRARISLVFAGDTGLPMTDFQAIDQRSGGQHGYERALLGKSGGGWLGQDDRVAMPLMLNGIYTVVLRLYEDGVPGPVSTELGTIQVVLDGAAPQTVTFVPPDSPVHAALAELQARKGAAQGNQRAR